MAVKYITGALMEVQRAGMEGSKEHLGLILEFVRQRLLIHASVWHSSQSQWVLWILVILLAFVKLFAFAGFSNDRVIDMTVNNTIATVVKNHSSRRVVILCCSCHFVVHLA